MLFDMIARLALIAAGIFIIWRTMISGIRTFVLPRGVNDRLALFLYLIVLRLFRSRAAREVTYEGRDRVMAMFAPTALIMLPMMWFALMLIAFGLIYWALGEPHLSDALMISGYSLTTLGYRSSGVLARDILEFTEALFGLILIGLLISYLPTMYSAFSRRESLVTLLDVRAGSPPSAVEALSRAHRIRSLDTLEELFQQWEVWFAELQESHTSLGCVDISS